jgi:DNA recombination protein RmuC
MELTPYLVGALIGAVLALIFLYLLFKSKTVERKEYDQLASKLNDASANLKWAEERLKSNQELSGQLEQKADNKQNELSALMAKTASLEASWKSTTERLNEYITSLSTEKEINRNQQNELMLHQRQVAELKAQNISLAEKLEAHKSEILEMQKTAHLQFEKLAQQIFEEKTGKFTEANKSNMEALLKPLADNIDSFKKKVEETYDKESKQRFSLEEKVKDLITNTNKISEEANNLATALKGQVKKQGDWGETILERILESSGLEKGREYFVQENIKDEEGKNFRPDIIVRLPDNKKIIVDSKVSLNAYLRYSESDSPEEKAIQAAKHLQAINSAY